MRPSSQSGLLRALATTPPASRLLRRTLHTAGNFRAVPGVRLAWLSALPPLALAAALLAVPAGQARAHSSSAATLHAETNPLHKAAEAGDLDSVNHFIADHGVTVNVKDSDGQTPLHKTAVNGRVSIASALIAAGADVNVKDNISGAPLHYAAVYGRVSVVSALIAAGASLNVKDSQGQTPLHYAGIFGEVSIASALIAAGAEVDAKADNDETPLHYAAGFGQVSVVSALIAAGAEVDAKADNDETPLHKAARNGRAPVVSTLIAEGADVNAKNSGGETPLRKAGGGGKADVVSALIAAGGNWGEACESGKTVNPAGPSPPCVCQPPYVRMGDNCAPPGVQSCGALTPPLFYDAALPACVQFVECDEPAALNEGTNRCDCPAPKIGADGAAPPGDCHPENALLTAAEAGDLDFVNRLIAVHMADVNVKDDIDRTPLHYAANNGHAAVLATLIAARANVNAQDFYNLTPLHLAADNGHAAVVPALVAAGADVNAKDDSSGAPLHYAALNGNVSVVLTLIAAGADVNAKYDGDETPLRLAASRRNTAAYQALIAAGGHWGEACENPAVVNPARSAPPCLCQSPNIRINGNCAAPGVDSCGALAPPRFYAATLAACLPFVECDAPSLMNAETNRCDCPAPNIGANGAGAPGDCHPQNALYQAAGAGDLDLVNRLISVHMANVNATTSSVGETPLHNAAGNGHAAVVSALIAAGARLNVKNNDGDTPLRVSHPRAVSLLIAAGGHWGEACANAAVVNPAAHSPPCLCQSPNVETNLGVCEAVAACDAPSRLNPGKNRCDCPAPNLGTDGADPPGACVTPDAKGCGTFTPPQFYNAALSTCVPFVKCDAPSRLNPGTNRCDCPAPNLGTRGADPPGVCAPPDAEGCRALAPPQFYDAAARKCAPFVRCHASAVRKADNTGCECPAADSELVGSDGACVLSAVVDKCEIKGWPLSNDYGSCGILLTLAGGTASDQCYFSDSASPQCEEVFGSNLHYLPAPVLSAENATLRFVYNCDPNGESGLIPATVNTIAATECGCGPDASLLGGVCVRTSGDFRLLDEVLCGAFGGTVRIATGGKVCSGIDDNGTFCIINSNEAFPCRGLFKHLRTCNLTHNRPALNPFFCGENCGVQKAVGSGCR